MEWQRVGQDLVTDQGQNHMGPNQLEENSENKRNHKEERKLAIGE